MIIAMTLLLLNELDKELERETKKGSAATKTELILSHRCAYGRISRYIQLRNNREH